eukprot:jgi/Bigna1/89115/estExt_fgenesh1_pg.C_440029
MAYRSMNVFANLEDSKVEKESKDDMRNEPQAALSKSTGVVKNRKGVVATLTGLEGVHIGEILRFVSGVEAIVMEIRTDFVRAAILGDGDSVENGENVYRLHKSLSIPVGSGSLGRVFDALGRPMNESSSSSSTSSSEDPREGADDSATTKYDSDVCALSELGEDTVFYDLNLEKMKPHKQLVCPRFISTRLKCLDVFRPLVAGGKFGILGPRNTKKADTALSIMAGQLLNEESATTEAGIDGVGEADDAHFYIYVTIGRSRRGQEEIEEKIRKIGALERSIIIHAGEDSGPVLQYLAPMVASTMSNFFRDNGMHVLVVFDELSSHHAAYEMLSEQMELARPAIVQTFARIMQHFSALPTTDGGGSSTAIALVDTMGDVEAVIEPYVEELTTFLDSAVHVDSKLASSGLYPGIKLHSLMKSTPSPYQLPMVRGFYTRIVGTLRGVNTLAQRAAMANELGIDLVEEQSDYRVGIEDEIAFPDKFEALMNQLAGQPLQLTLIALYMATKNLLMGWELRELPSHDAAVQDFLLEERPELLMPWPVDREVPDFVFEDLDALALTFAWRKIGR